VHIRPSFRPIFNGPNAALALYSMHPMQLTGMHAVKCTSLLSNLSKRPKRLALYSMHPMQLTGMHAVKCTSLLSKRSTSIKLSLKIFHNTIFYSIHH
jgi:hypothetical protein